jgi:hypothetical protein
LPISSFRFTINLPNKKEHHLQKILFIGV